MDLSIARLKKKNRKKSARLNGRSFRIGVSSRLAAPSITREEIARPDDEYPREEPEEAADDEFVAGLSSFLKRSYKTKKRVENSRVPVKKKRR